MHCSCGNTSRLACMLFLVAAYFLIELIVGYAIHSLSLVADAFHMLSDFMALVVGLVATRIAKWPSSSKNTFGWQRAEVMGGLINSVVLITLCATILMQAIQRFIMTESIENPKLMIYVGGGGLLVNVIGLLVLGVHSHDDHGETIEIMENDMLESVALDEQRQDREFSHQSATSNGALISGRPENIPPTRLNHLQDVEVDRDSRRTSSRFSNERSKKAKHAKSLNMRAVFLHVLADFFGSIIVVISALLLTFAPGDIDAAGSWKLYVDPAMSVLMVLIILASAIPLTYKAALILLQSVPSEICLTNLKTRLEAIDGIHKVHDLHVWRLQSNCIIGTVHIRCAGLPDYYNVAQQVKSLFHDFNIHCTTIQPEFEEDYSTKQIQYEPFFTVYSERSSRPENDYKDCVLDCGPNRNCQSDTCCPAPSTTTASTRPSVGPVDNGLSTRTSHTPVVVDGGFGLHPTPVSVPSDETHFTSV